MMKAQYFVYTRNKTIDYKSFYSPSEQFCPKETKKKFLKEIRGVIDVETYDDPLESFRWLYSCSDGILLFGVGTMNSNLSETCNLDFANRPVRGFFGIVLKYSQNEVCLPMDIKFFQYLYKQYIEPIWELDRDSLPNQTIELDLENLAGSFNMLYPKNCNLTLNYQGDRCVILGDVDPADVFANALHFGQSVSIVAGFGNKRHAYSLESDYKYMNAVVAGVPDREEKRYSVPPQLSYDNEVTETQVAEKPKKALGPKLILILAGLVVFIILLVLCPKRCQNQQTIQNRSVSGLEVQMQSAK